MELSEERRARNQTVFREANEQIAETAERIELTGSQIPLLCECPDPGCTVVIGIDRDEYEAVRSHPRHFLACAGHEPDETPVVRSEEGYCVFEKTGLAGEIAEAQVERTEGAQQ
jgi:hypothetical protein